MQKSDITEDTKWEKLSQEIKSETIRYFKNRVVVSRADIEKKWSVTTKTIQRYIKDEMPKCEELSKRNFQVFYLDECEQWKAKNINREQSKRVNKSKSKDAEVETGGEEESNDEAPLSDNKRMSTEEGERREKRAKALTAEMKLDEMKGILILAEDQDISLYEQAIMHKTDKHNDEKILPILLEMKSAEEIRELLVNHNDDRLDLLDSQVEQRFKKDPSNYEIFEEVLQQRRKGKMPVELIKRLSC